MFRKVEIDLRERLNSLEQEWLTNHLEAKRGVRIAGFSRFHASRLVIGYDANLVSSYTLWESCHLCGLRAQFVLPPGAVSADGSPVASSGAGL